MTDIDFSTPYWLIYSYHIIGTVSLAFDLFSIYLILYKSDKIDNFKYFLLNFQIVCCLFDIHVTFISQAVPLYPLLAGYVLGVAAHFDISIHICLEIAIGLIVYQIESMIFCFVRKHQTIASTLKKYAIPSVLVWLLASFFAIYLAGIVGFFSRTVIDGDERLEYVRQLHPNYLPAFQSLPNFSIYIADSYFITVVLVAVLCGIVAFSILCLIILNIFRMLRMLKTQISTSTYKKHRAAVWSLLAQFSTSSICFVPPIIYVFVVLIGVSGMQLIVEVIILIGCCHSIFNVSVLVITFPPYRKFVLSVINKRRNVIMSKLPKSSAVVVS